MTKVPYVLRKPNLWIFKVNFTLKNEIHQKSAQIVTIEPNEFSQGKLTCVVGTQTEKWNIASTPAGPLYPTQPPPRKGSQQQLKAAAGGLEEGRGLWQMWTRACSRSAVLILEGGGSQGWGRSSSWSGGGASLGKRVLSRVKFALIGGQWQPLLVRCGITSSCTLTTGGKEVIISRGCPSKSSSPQTR